MTPNAVIQWPRSGPDGMEGSTADQSETEMDNNTPEKRCCDECGHKGTDGGSTTESYCDACGATVPYPDEDLCPDCGATNCMLIACPECGGRYSLDEEHGDGIETPNAALTGAEGVRVEGTVMQQEQ